MPKSLYSAYTEEDMLEIDKTERQKLINLAEALIDQERARILIPALKQESGYWFGGGNMVKDSKGNFYVSGRYRNAGDSRTGTAKGPRGFELTIFKSNSPPADNFRNNNFENSSEESHPNKSGTGIFYPVKRFTKKDLSCGDYEVVSIEGSALQYTRDGVELYVSVEKAGIPYPKELQRFQKPGTGVWTIDVIRADTFENLDASNIQPLIQSEDPRFLHVKDPLTYRNGNGDTILIFCTHPFNWSSSNSAYAVKKRGSENFGSPRYRFFPRGYTWDVAMSRITDVLAVPEKAVKPDIPQLYLYFYDGGESVRNYTEHERAVKRPRGYSCEEIGGLAFSTETGFPEIERLSVNLPLFVSPHGTGSSRYVKTLIAEEGIYAIWQQSQNDFSQPLVFNFLSNSEIEKILR